MSTKLNDPLLIAAKVIVVIARILTIVGMVVLGLVSTALLTVGHSKLAGKLAEADIPPEGLWGIVLAMLVGAGLLYLAFRFFGELSGIIDSVGEGEPFRADNADRLRRMGWITVIAQAAFLPLAGIAAWFAPYADKADAHLHIDGGLDGGSILLTLILFILARVFREGTRMREELEGTV